MKSNPTFELERARRLALRGGDAERQFESARESTQYLEQILARLAGEPPSDDVCDSLDEIFGLDDAPTTTGAIAPRTPTTLAALRA